MLQCRPILRSVVLATILLLVAGCTKTESQYLESARQLHANGDRTGAMLELKNVLKANPNNGQARYLLGVLHNEVRNSKEAEKELKRAHELGLVEGGRVLAELGRAMVADGEYKRVLAEIKISDAFEPHALATIHSVRGHAALLLGDFKNARNSLEAGAQLGLDNPDVILLRARLLIAERQYDQALASVDATLKSSPKHIESLLLRADLLHLTKRSADALAVYDTIIASDRVLVPAHVARTMLLVNLGKYDEAQKSVDAIRRISRSLPVGHFLQALVHFKRKRLTDAHTSVLEALRLVPDYPAALLLAGGIAHGQGSFAQAEQSLAKFLYRFPGSISARKLLASSQMQLRKSREAFETIQPLLASEAADAVALAIAGDALVQAGDLGQAGRYYERAVAKRPDDPLGKTALALNRLRQGDAERALAELEAAAKADQAEHRADFVLITTLYRRGEHAKALEAIARLEGQIPKSPLPHNLAGVVHVARKDIAAARKSFERAIELDPLFFAATVNLARLDAQEKRHDDAKRRFERVLAKNDKHLQAMLALSEIAATTNDAETMLKWLERARAAHPSAIDPLGRLSAYYIARGEMRKGLDYAQEAASRNPALPSALDILGTAQVATREYNAAAQTYAKLVQLSPHLAIGHYRLGSVQGALGDLRAAEASYRRAVSIDAEYLSAWMALGTVQINLDKHEDALKSARHIRGFAPTSPQGHLVEGEALLRLKRYPEAVKAFEQALKVEPNGPHMVKLYIAMVRGGNGTAALSRLEQHVQSNAQDQASRLTLADAYLERGRYTDAIKQYEILLAARPKDALVLNNLAGSYLAIKDPRAVEFAKRAHEIVDKDPIVMDTYGWALVESGKLKEGLALLENARRLAPKNDEITFHYAAALARIGSKEQARREIEVLIASKSTFAERAKALLGAP